MNRTRIGHRLGNSITDLPRIRRNANPGLTTKGDCRPRHKRILAILMAFGFFLIASNSASAATTQGVWTPLTYPYPLGRSTLMYLLTDGSVMVQGAMVNIANSAKWYKLTPDAQGNYVNGTWSAVSPMSGPRYYYSGWVLPDGRLFLLGGYANGYPLNTAEIYNPVANSWTKVQYPSAFDSGPSILLGDGTILCGDQNDALTYLFHPSTNTFTPGPSKLVSGAYEPEQFVLLPGGNVLSYAVYQPNSQAISQVYSTKTKRWTTVGGLAGYGGGVMGPPMLLPTGKVFWPAATENSLYNPITNTWNQAANAPAGVFFMGRNSPGNPGVMSPDGHFLVMFGSFYQPGIVDYDYSSNSLTDITRTLPSKLETQLSSNSYGDDQFSTLLLPNGHLLLNTAAGTIWDYAPSGKAPSSWRPTITAIQSNGATNLLTGTQLTGLWQGSSMPGQTVSTNYPIVSLKGPGSSNTVRYARTTNWTPSVATGSAAAGVVFTLPPTIPSGNYQLQVSANGIISASRSFTVTPKPMTLKALLVQAIGIHFGTSDKP